MGEVGGKTLCVAGVGVGRVVYRNSLFNVACEPKNALKKKNNEVCFFKNRRRSEKEEERKTNQKVRS